MDYQSWQETVPEAMRQDSLWNLAAYRFALFMSDIAWYDTTKLLQDRRTAAIAEQLYRAIGSISANLGEGYSRRGPDRARFYEYALGSARESRDWYYKSRHILGDLVVKHRFQFLGELIRLLGAMAPQQRGRSLREPGAGYEPDTEEQAIPGPDVLDLFAPLLSSIPLPDARGVMRDA